MNILSTIPRRKFNDWKVCEKVLKRCDGERMFWLINCTSLPTKAGIGAVCYLIFDGAIRGYFDIVDTDRSENYRDRHRIGKPRNTHCIVLANWHPIAPIQQTGFQGYRYTDLHPCQ